MNEIFEIPECKTIEEVEKWLDRLRKEIGSNRSKSIDKRDWIRVENPVIMDDFSWLLKETEEEDNIETK